MVSLEEQEFVDTMFNINQPEVDDYFRSLGTFGGNRYKPVSLKLGIYLKSVVREELMHVELHEKYAIIWDKADWDLASLGAERRKTAREENRALVNVRIEEMAQIETWVENLITRDKNMKAKGRKLWMIKLTNIYETSGLNTVKDLIELLGETFVGNKQHFL